MSTTLGVYSHVVPEVFSGVTVAVNDVSRNLQAGTYALKMSGKQVRKQLQQLDPLLPRMWKSASPAASKPEKPYSCIQLPT